MWSLFWVGVVWLGVVTDSIGLCDSASSAQLAWPQRGLASTSLAPSDLAESRASERSWGSPLTTVIVASGYNAPCIEMRESLPNIWLWAKLSWLGLGVAEDLGL